MTGETPRSGGAAGSLTAEDVATLAAKLREACVLALLYVDPDPGLAAWCLRMLAEPGAAERAVEAIERATR